METAKKPPFDGRRADRLAAREVSGIDGNYPRGWILGYTADVTPVDVETCLPTAELFNRRIVAFDSGHSITASYDVLRNHLRDEYDQPQTVAISACSSGCGTTVTAINLALSFARLPESSVLLVDANLGNSKVCETLGVMMPTSSEEPSHESLSTVGLGGSRLSVLQGRLLPTGTVASEGDLAKLVMQVEAARQFLKPTFVVMDLPPVLNRDDAFPLIGISDVAVVIAASGQTKRADLQLVRGYFGKNKKVQFVLNKVGKYSL